MKRKNLTLRQRVAISDLRKCRIPLREIAQRYGISVEAVRRVADEYDANPVVPHEDMATLKRAYHSQKGRARSRGLAFEFTFDEWLKIWQDSGKLAERGPVPGYCMSRKGDKGGYTHGNVFIQLTQENSRDAGFLPKPAAKPPEEAGVTLGYPGSVRPWVVNVGWRYFSGFGTKEEAIAARAAMLKKRAQAPKDVFYRASREWLLEDMNART